MRAPVVAWRSGRSEVNEQAKRGRREEGELPPQQLAHELLMTQAAFEDKYADMQDELVTSRRRVEQLETELEAVTSLHNAMLKDQYAVAEEMGLRDQVTLGDPLLLMKAREMYETRIAALKAGEESLTKDNRRLKEQRKDLQVPALRWTR